MKTYSARALLAGALCLTMVAPAGAINVSGVAGLGASAVVNVVRDKLESTVWDTGQGQPVGFSGLEKRVCENNATIRTLEKQLAGLGNTDIDAQFDAQEFSVQSTIAGYQNQIQTLRKQIATLEMQLESADENKKDAIRKQIAAAEVSLIAAQSGLGVAQTSLDSIDDAREAAQQELDDQYASVEKQLENLKKTMTVMAQSVYLGLVELADGIETVDRNLAALDRQITVVEKQVEIGMASQLTLDNIKYSRTALTSQRETLVIQQGQLENQLAMLCGGGADSRMYITGVPTVTSTQLREIDYTDDLEQALKNSYSIWVKQDAVRQASNDYEDDVTSSLDYYEAAKIDLEAEKDNVTSAFRQLYTDVQQKQRLLDEAQAAYEMEEKNFAVDQLQYDRGMISKMDYLTAQDDLAAAQDAVTTAEHDLFTAYNTYDWARRGYMGSTGA